MMTLSCTAGVDDSRLNLLIPLYEEPFPESRKRKAKQLKQMIENRTPTYFNAIECNGELSRMSVYWDIDDFYCLEHLTIFPGMQNKKIRQWVLDYVTGHLKGLHPLEVEPTEDEMTTWCMNYYRRSGYKVLDRTYVQPSYHTVENVCSLWIMGNEDSLRLSKQVERIKEEVYRQQIG